MIGCILLGSSQKIGIVINAVTVIVYAAIRSTARMNIRTFTGSLDLLFLIQPLYSFNPFLFLNKCLKPVNYHRFFFNQI